MVADAVSEEREVPLDVIEIRPDLQLRAKTSEDAVKDYAADMLLGDIFPPVRLFLEGENGSARYFIGDGNHRVLAAGRIGRKTIRAVVSSGGRKAALDFAFTANAKNGLRLSVDDRKRRIEVALATYPDWSTARLAEFLRVRQSAVRVIREAGGAISTGRIGKDGRVRRPIRRADLRPERPEPTAPRVTVMPAVSSSTPANFPASKTLDPSFLNKFRVLAPGLDEAARMQKRRADEALAQRQRELALEAIRAIPAENPARADALRLVREWIEEEERKAAAGEPAEDARALGAKLLDAQFDAERDAEWHDRKGSVRDRDASGRFV